MVRNQPEWEGTRHQTTLVHMQSGQVFCGAFQMCLASSLSHCLLSLSKGLANYEILFWLFHTAFNDGLGFAYDISVLSQIALCFLFFNKYVLHKRLHCFLCCCLVPR